MLKIREGQKMYKVNSLMRPTLITVDEVLFHAPTKDIVDRRMIESSIIVAEERFIRPELGFDMYERICNSKNKLVTNANKATLQSQVGTEPVLVVDEDYVNALEYLSSYDKTLWKQHLWKIVAECVITSAYPEGFVQMGAEGTMHNSPPAGLMVTSGFVTPLISSMKWAVDKKVKDRIAPLLQSMHNFICRNRSNFTYYGLPCPGCDEEKNQKFTGLALGLYDDEEEDCCEPSVLFTDYKGLISPTVNTPDEFDATFDETFG